MNAVVSFPRVVNSHEPGLRVIYAAIDAYADRIAASSDARHRMKSAGREALLSGESRAMSILIAKEVVK
jgi:hypothetical protein